MAEGDLVSLTCMSGCATPVNIVWFRDGKPVINAVFRASREFAGRYHCAVWEQQRIRSAPVALNVMCKSVMASVAITDLIAYLSSSVEETIDQLCQQ